MHDDESVKETHDSECENLVSWLVKRVTIYRHIAYLEHAFTGAGPKNESK